MKTKSKSSRISERYGLIEALEARIAPASAAAQLPANPYFVTAPAGGSVLVRAGEVLTTGSGGTWGAGGGGGAYLLYVASGEVLVHTTDLNHNNSIDFNEVTGLSVSSGAVFAAFVDIHGDVVTDLNANGTLTDGGKGDILLDANINTIDLRTLTAADFSSSAAVAADQTLNAHLAMSSYSIFGNIYAGGGLGVANNTSSGLLIDNSGGPLQSVKFNGISGTSYYQATEPVIGSIYVGSSASGHNYSFGASGSSSDIFGNLLAFNAFPGEAGASIYNIAGITPTMAFSIGTIHAGDGGFNAPGGSIVNVALFGDNAGTYQLIAGNAGNGTTGHAGGSIVNFSEGGAFISEAVLQTGNGGSALIGAGGSGGSVTFNPKSPVQLNAHVVIQTGNGADGYSAGGAGGSVHIGAFTTPNGKLTTATDIVSTMHTIGSIGSTTPFDFNSDGYSDMVYSTANPSQVVVALGSANAGFGFSASDYIYLNSPAQVDSIVVGNFTGVMNPITHLPQEDIAVASGAGSHAGVEVYLSEYNPKTGAFEGFSDPLFTPLPAITMFSGSSGYPFLESSVSITKLVAGDFTGDGVLGLAVLANETQADTFSVDPVLIFLHAETNAANPGGTGYFYWNFNSGSQLADLNPGPATTAPGTIMEATAFQTFTPGAPGVMTANHDYIVASVVGSKGFSYIDDSSGSPGVFKGGGFGTIDINRNLSVVPYVPSTASFTLQGLTVIGDPQSPNIADVIAISQPFTVEATGKSSTFVAALTGNGTGTFTLQTEPGGDPPGNEALAGVVLLPNPSQQIVTIPDPVTLQYTDFAVLYEGGPTGAPPTETIQAFTPSYGLPPPAPGAQLPPGDVALNHFALGEMWFSISTVNGTAPGPYVFDAYYPHPTFDFSVPGSGPGEVGFITPNFLVNYQDYQGFGISNPDGSSTSNSFTPFKDAGYFVTAGNGGNSLSGTGGNGGSLGQTLTVTDSGGVMTGTGTLSFQFPSDLTYGGGVYGFQLIMQAGNGGNGFSNAGSGGHINGISVTYAPGTSLLADASSLTAGNGGESLTGAGGAGGSLGQLYVIAGEIFTAGNGGIGVTGGNAGSLYGNLQPGLVTASSNSDTGYIALTAGNGANGINGGGSGGSINSFVNDFLPLIGAAGGTLQYVAGNGGTAVGGSGGMGGSIVKSSPYALDDNLAGDISLQGGNGGSGLSGGAGGGINIFNVSNTNKEIPSSCTVIAGTGGGATIGVGGAGGNIASVLVSSSGIGTAFISGQKYDVTYNRTVAGAGGSSDGGRGGAGGSIGSITTASVAITSQDVVAAGAGGFGLTAGGNGGSVTNASVNAGSSGIQDSGKVVVIAGDGGASLSGTVVTPNPTPQQVAINVVNSTGGLDGPGGNGGSITGFSQPGNINAFVDLIAGNGGATINHSFASGNATKDNSGTGGSINLSGIGVAGSIGDCDPTVAIKSYNDLLNLTGQGSQTMQQFVTSYVVGTPSLPMDNNVGNVGLVAGAAGYVESPIGISKSLQASINGVNGSVTNIHAENIMSMVAGNVEQVSAIKSLTNYGLTVSTGILGAPKKVSYILPNFGPNPVGFPTALNYITVDGTLTTTPQLLDTWLTGGGALLDGALLASNVRTTLSTRDFVGTVF